MKSSHVVGCKSKATYLLLAEWGGEQLGNDTSLGDWARIFVGRHHLPTREYADSILGATHANSGHGRSSADDAGRLMNARWSHIEGPASERCCVTAASPFVDSGELNCHV